MKRCRPALGTFVEIALPDVSGADASHAFEAIDRAFAAIRDVETRMSFHAADSELTRLNRFAHRVPQRVGTSTLSVLAMAIELHARTDGLFDCAVGSHLVGRRLLPDHDGAVGGAETPGATLADLELQGDGRVSFRRPMCLDLGGIAKGYAVDRAIEVLAECDVGSAVVNAGGDLRAMGEVEVPIHLRDPGDPTTLVFGGTLSDGAIATSAAYWSPRRDDGGLASALIDPLDGRSLQDKRSFSVIAPTCMVADALTKAVALARDGPTDFLACYGAQVLVLAAAGR